MNRQEQEWYSASELAALLKVSTQTIYNRIRRGEYETQPFKRGMYNGFLIKYISDGTEEANQEDSQRAMGTSV